MSLKRQKAYSFSNFFALQLKYQKIQSSKEELEIMKCVNEVRRKKGPQSCARLTRSSTGDRVGPSGSQRTHVYRYTRIGGKRSCLGCPRRGRSLRGRWAHSVRT